MASERAIELAASIWCLPETSEKEMDVILAEGFADVLDKTFTAKEAVKTLSTIMKEDPEYAWAWHCNVAVASIDQGLSHQKSNEAAANFMHILFGVRMWEHPNYVSFLDQWSKEENPE